MLMKTEQVVVHAGDGAHRSHTFFLRLALHKDTDHRDPYTERFSVHKRYVSSTEVSSQTSFGSRTLDGDVGNLAMH
jgi:hypothetical protein